MAREAHGSRLMAHGQPANLVPRIRAPLGHDLRVMRLAPRAANHQHQASNIELSSCHAIKLSSCQAIKLSGWGGVRKHMCTCIEVLPMSSDEKQVSGHLVCVQPIIYHISSPIITIFFATLVQTSKPRLQGCLCTAATPQNTTQAHV